jgi:hypothetical protein
VAEGHLLRGLTIASQLDDHSLEAHCRLGLADLASGRGELRGARAELIQVTRLAHTLPLSALNLPAAVWQRWARLAQAQGAPGGQAALLWALAAVYNERDGGTAASSLWEEAERVAAAAGEPGGRAGLAARAQAALAHDGEWGLLEEILGPSDTDHPGGGEAAPGA